MICAPSSRSSSGVIPFTVPSVADRHERRRLDDAVRGRHRRAAHACPFELDAP